LQDKLFKFMVFECLEPDDLVVSIVPIAICRVAVSALAVDPALFRCVSVHRGYEPEACERAR